MSEKAISSTTQEFLDVYDIVNDMVLLKDGTASIIMQVGTMNFSLLAEQEQDAIIFTYGSLLNSLNYPIQISIQSQTKDATKYLRLLDEQVQKASSDRKAALIKQYRNFVAALIKERNVLEKHFYITVPAGPAEMGLITPSSVLPGKTAFDITTIEKSIILEKATNILEPRRDHLAAQFNRLGLYVRQLNTQEIIQNFYINYNPEAAEGQEISNNENYTTPLVRASFGGKNMQTNDQTQNPTPEEILSDKPISNQTPVQQIDTTQASQAPAGQDSTQQIEPTQLEPSHLETVQVEASDPQNEVSPSLVQPDFSQIGQTPLAEQAAPIKTIESTEPTAPIEPTYPQAETSLPPMQTEPLMQTEQPIETASNANPNASLDLNLDPSLIKNSQPEQTPVFDPNQNMNDLMSNTQSAPVEAEVANTVENPAETEASSDFAEEITPLQNKLESQTSEKTAQAGE